MSHCVMQKNWFTVFNVKVTVRDYIIKIWLYLLYLLNYWSICNQTWFWWYNIISRSILWTNWITAYKAKVTAMVQYVSECLTGWHFLNCRIFCYQTLYGNAASCARVSCRKQKLFAIFQVKVTARAHKYQNMTLLYLLNCWFLGNQTWSDDTSS